MAHKWTNEELEFLQANADKGPTAIHSVLSNIPIPAIRYKLKTLGISTKPYYWSDDDLEYLNTNYSTKTVKELATALTRTPEAIRLKLNRLNLKAKEDTKGPKPGSKYIRGVNRGVNRGVKYTDEYLLDIIKSLPHTGRDWYNINKHADWPSASTIATRFGSWTNALLKAGRNINIGTQKKDKATKVYLIKFDTFYKVGITQQEIKARFSGYPKYEIILVKETTLDNAKYIEKEILNLVQEYSYEPECFPKEGRGFTECFIAPRRILTQCEVYFQE